MLTCEHCHAREAHLRLEGLVDGRHGTYLYCKECAEELMRRTPTVEEDAAGAALDPAGARGEDRAAMRKWEYCLIDRSIPGVSPTAVFIERGIRRVEQIANALEHMAVLGADGWELVGIEVVNTPPGPDGLTTPAPGVSGAYYWFKRPIE